MPRRPRQASQGTVTTGVYATYYHDASQAALVAAELHSSILQTVLVNLQPATAWQVRWSKSGFPTISNPDILYFDPMFLCLSPQKADDLLRDQSLQTAVEAGDGIFPAVRPTKRRRTLDTIPELANIFDECISPAQLQPSTRQGYWASWRSALTWAIAHGDPSVILPMTNTTLRALSQEMLMLGSSAGTITNLWSAIEDRHRRLGYLPPLCAPGMFRRMVQAVASVKGTPSPLIFPIGIHHIKAMLQLVGLSPAQTRDILACTLGTILCLRVNEVALLQICDVLWDYDAAWDPTFSGSAAVRVYRRKQDQRRKGLYPRIGKARFAAFDLVARLRTYAMRQNLSVSHNCTKSSNPGARCRNCPPLFPTVNRIQEMSRQQITKAVVHSLQMIGTDTSHFSGISMRRGGISAALLAHVPEPILFLQSGHGSGNAARNYMIPRDPHILFETFQAFHL